MNKLRNWQIYLANYLAGEIHPCEVLIILDLSGNIGKHFFQRHYKIINDDTLIINGSFHESCKKSRVPAKTIFFNLMNTKKNMIKIAKNIKVLKTEWSHLIVFTKTILDWTIFNPEHCQLLTVQGDIYNVTQWPELLHVEKAD